jgi:hypothetical protein
LVLAVTACSSWASLGKLFLGARSTYFVIFSSKPGGQPILQKFAPT